MMRVKVITGPERRRPWSAEQKRAMVAESEPLLLPNSETV
jgi:hypothetical protein